MPNQVRIKGNALLADVENGMGDAALLKKYGLRHRLLGLSSIRSLLVVHTSFNPLYQLRSRDSQSDCELNNCCQ